MLRLLCECSTRAREREEHTFAVIKKGTIFLERTKRAILVVSFGTSYEETRKKTIDKIEESIKNEYPQYRVYRAWTSAMIRKKLLRRDGIVIPDVAGAMEEMLGDGITDVIVQPTHVLNGIENDKMEEQLRSYRGRFAHIVMGAPLLTTPEDNERVIGCVASELAPSDEEALVLMGHGTEHFANFVYAALDLQFKDKGYKNIFLGTVEAYPDFETLLRRVEKLRPKRVLLAPFMIVAGDHALNDLAGSDRDSWKSRMEAAGYETQCILKGLGEYEGIRRLFLSHVAESEKVLELVKDRDADFLRTADLGNTIGEGCGV